MVSLAKVIYETLEGQKMISDHIVWVYGMKVLHVNKKISIFAILHQLN